MSRRLKVVSLICLSIVMPIYLAGIVGNASMIDAAISHVLVATESFLDGLKEKDNSNFDGMQSRERSISQISRTITRGTEEIEEEIYEEATPSQATPSEATMSNAMLARELLPHEAVVYTYAELKRVIENKTNGITTVYLGEDITGTNTGIRIPPEKNNLIIDGSYEGVVHTYTQYPSDLLNRGIYINQKEVTNITVKNMDVVGKNWYGIVGVAYLTYDVTTTYENITYRGRQFAHNPTGYVVVKDCDVTIQSTGNGVVNEFLEATGVDIYGNLNINSNSGEEIFSYYYSSGNRGKDALTLHENANVTIRSAGAGNGMIQTMESGPVKVWLKKGAKLNYEGVGVGVGKNSSSSIKDLTMEDGSEWIINLSATTNLSTPIRFGGTIDIQKGANLEIYANGSRVSNLVSARSGFHWNIDGSVKILATHNLANAVVTNGLITIGNTGKLIIESNLSSGTNFLSTAGLTVNGGELRIISDSSSNTQMLLSSKDININPGSTVHLINKGTGLTRALINVNGSNTKLTINKPKSVIFYEPSKRLIQYSSEQDLNMEANQINQWNQVSYPASGTFDGLPTFHWIHNNNTAVQIIGRLKSGANGSYTVNHSNYNGMETNPVTGMTIAMKALSMGEIQVELDDYYVGDTEVTGITEPDAIVRISAGGQVFDTTADENGNFQYAISGLNIGDVIEVAVNKYFLYQETEKKVIASGDLKFLNIPSTLQFKNTEIPTAVHTVERREANWTIQVEDSRTNKSKWQVSARLLSPLTPNTADTLPALEEAIVFVAPNGQRQYLNQTMPVKVFETDAGNTLTDIRWDQTQGILAELKPGLIYKDVMYQADIEWILQDAP